MNIPSIDSIRGPAAIREPAAAAGGGDFQAMLESAVRRVDSVGRESRAGVERFLAGEGEDLHKVILEVQRAELAMELFLQVRNKVVGAYQEVMRMQL